MDRRSSIDDQKKQNIAKLLGDGITALEITKYFKKLYEANQKSNSNINFTRKACIGKKIFFRQ